VLIDPNAALQASSNNKVVHSWFDIQWEGENGKQAE